MEVNGYKIKPGSNSAVRTKKVVQRLAVAVVFLAGFFLGLSNTATTVFQPEITTTVFQPEINGYTNLRGVNLQGADLTNENLAGAWLPGSGDHSLSIGSLDQNDAILQGATMPDGSKHE